MNRTMKPHMIAAWNTPAYGSRLATVRLSAVLATLPVTRRANPSGEPMTSWRRPAAYLRSLTPTPTMKISETRPART